MNTSAERLTQLAFHTAAWTCLFATFRQVPFRARDAVFSNRAVSLIHAFVAIYLTTAATDPGHPFRNFGKESQPLEVPPCLFKTCQSHSL